MNAKAVHKDLLADLAEAIQGDTTPYTAFPWIVIANLGGKFPKLFLEPPSIVPSMESDTLSVPAYNVTWNLYYVNRYAEGTAGNINPHDDMLDAIDAILSRYNNDPTSRAWTTAAEIVAIQAGVLADNPVNSWARDLVQPYACVQFVIRAVLRDT